MAKHPRAPTPRTDCTFRALCLVISLSAAAQVALFLSTRGGAARAPAGARGGWALAGPVDPHRAAKSGGVQQRAVLDAAPRQRGRERG